MEADRSRLEQLAEADCAIGSRQTVDVVEIPGLGRGRLVWKHGPAFFLLNGPSPELPEVGAIGYRVARVSLGGASVTEGSWNRVWLPGHHEMRAKLIEQGEDHGRWFSPLFGDGWLITEKLRYWYRFEDLDGVVRLRFNMSALGMGRPAYYDKMVRARTRMPKMTDPDEENWSTFVTTDGERYTFRRGGTPPIVEKQG